MSYLRWEYLRRGLLWGEDLKLACEGRDVSEVLGGEKGKGAYAGRDSMRF
jgi:hypothetical protein